MHKLPSHPLAWILVLATMGLAASCQQATSEQVVEDGNSLLWRIDGNGLTEPSYVYGTMHIIGEEDFSMGDHLLHVAQNSDLIVMELDMDDINPFALASSTMIPDGKGLSDYTDDSTYQAIKTIVRDSFGVSALEWIAYSKMKPFYMLSALAQSVVESPKSYEQEFVEIAKERDIEILGLEEPQEQLAMIDSIPLQKQVEILEDGLDEFDEFSWYIERMGKVYKSQNLDSLLALMDDPEYDSFMEFEALLLADRNERWISRMTEFMKDESVFFAVGAGHLPGDDGVLNLLQNAGYTVTAVSTE